MRPRAGVDAELHVLRSVARRAEDSRSRQELESARYAVYAAFEVRDAETARRWCRALRAALGGIEPELRQAGLEALSEIERAIEE